MDIKVKSQLSVNNNHVLVAKVIGVASSSSQGCSITEEKDFFKGKYQRETSSEVSRI